MEVSRGGGTFSIVLFSLHIHLYRQNPRALDIAWRHRVSANRNRIMRIFGSLRETVSHLRLKISIVR
eukprot:660441-Hanusia_phi.AAC.2